MNDPVPSLYKQIHKPISSKRKPSFTDPQQDSGDEEPLFPRSGQKSPPRKRSDPVLYLEDDELLIPGSGQKDPAPEPLEPVIDLDDEKCKFPIFHVAIDNPTDNTFPSFQSWELEGGDPEKTI